MAPPLEWTKLKECSNEDDYVKFRWEVFCCSAVRAKRDRPCIICPGEHDMIERRLRCRSETCESSTGPIKCPVRWKVHHCPVVSKWIILSNEATHFRGEIECAVPPRPKVTEEMKEYIHRMDENAVPPRLIWSNLLRAPDVPKPVLGYPTYTQVQRSVKHIRWLQGTKNSIIRTTELVRSKAFVADIDPDAAFVFGNREDQDGFPFVGNGEDDEPLILGITTLKLMEKIKALQLQEPFLIFHLDATFKLSDLGYPVITCGFTDKHRIYRLAALFIVSQRTQSEYYEAIATFSKVFQKHMKTRLRIDAVMGDAEAAQLNALQTITGFENATYLMCFFHVLYNVRKRIRHLPDTVRGVVYRGILDMHYATSQVQLMTVWARVSSEWKGDNRLWSFVEYFDSQWLSSRFWRWQIYHSPGGFATTNNPCEVFNASIKRFTLRKAMDTRRLILKLLTIAEDTSICIQPSTASARPYPPQEAKKLANVLVSSQRVAVFNTGEQSVVRVQYVGDGIPDDEDVQEITGIGDSQAAATLPNGVILSEGCLTDAEKRSAAKFYRSAVKWSVRRAHHLGMPPGGWVVRINTFECMCPYFTKFLSCAHVICGRVAFGLSVPGVGGQHLKFKNRRIRRAGQCDPRPKIPLLPRSAPLTPFEPVSPSTDLMIVPSPLEQYELVSSTVQEFLHNDTADVYTVDSSTVTNGSVWGTNNPTEAGISSFNQGTSAPMSVTGLTPRNTSFDDFSLPGPSGPTPISPPADIQQIGLPSLLQEMYPPPEEQIPFHLPRGRPPLASHALHVQYLLR